MQKNCRKTKIQFLLLKPLTIALILQAQKKENSHFIHTELLFQMEKINPNLNLYKDLLDTLHLIRGI